MARMDRHKVGTLYFIESEAQGAVKIGFADNLAMRLANLQTGNPANLTLRWWHAATRGAEQLLHRHLKPYRIGREWYHDTCLLVQIYDELGYELTDRAIDQEDKDGIPYTECYEMQHITEADILRVVPECIRDYQEWVNAGSPLSDDEIRLNELEAQEREDDQVHAFAARASGPRKDR